MKHTKGEWNVVGVPQLSERQCIESEEGWYIAEICEGIPNQQHIANAKLIAAAPDLLDALVNLLKATDNEGWENEGEDWEEQSEARKAIKKAIGR